jgi:hypothetical protein
VKQRVWCLSVFIVVVGCSPYVAPPLGPDHPASPNAREAPPPPPSQAFQEEPLPPPSAPKKGASSGHEPHGEQGMQGMPGM